MTRPISSRSSSSASTTMQSRPATTSTGAARDLPPHLDRRPKSPSQRPRPVSPGRYSYRPPERKLYRPRSRERERGWDRERERRPYRSRSRSRDRDVRRDRRRSRSLERDRRDRDRGRSRSPVRDRKRRERSYSPSRSRSRSQDRDRDRDGKRRARSYSPSRSPSRDRDRRREKRRRSRSRSSERSVSSDEERRHKRRKERHRSRSRDRKERKREKKEKKKSKKSGVVGGEWGKFGIISETDLYTKEQEFRAWLVEERMMNPETMSKDQTKKEFLKFVEDFNTATLPNEKFYNMTVYDARMAAMRSGAYVPPAEDGYDPNADMKAHASKHKRPEQERESYMSREQLMELRKVQQERIEAGKMKLLGMDIKQNMGVRMDGSKFDD